MATRRSLSVPNPPLRSREGVYCNQALQGCNRRSSRAIELHPEFSYGHVLRGRAHLELQEFGKAMSDFNAVPSDDLYHPEATFYRGNAFAGKGEFDKAQVDHAEAAELGFRVGDLGDWPD